MKPTCGVTFAAVCARTVRAGIIASSKGRPSVAPRPRSTVRRVRYFLVTNMSVAPCPFHDARPERGRVHDAQHDGRELVVRCLRIADDRADAWHVVVLDAAAKRIG